MAKKVKNDNDRYVRMEKDGKALPTPKFRASFVHVFEKGKGYKGGPGKYSITMIFSNKTDLSELKQTVFKAVRKIYGKKADGGWPKKIAWPWKDGNEEGRPEYKNSTIVKASSKNKPGIVDKDGKTELIDGEEFYSGCYARATVTAAVYGDDTKEPGVSLYLNNIQKLGDGKKFSGGPSAQEQFDEVEGEEDDEDNYENDDEADDDFLD